MSTQVNPIDVAWASGHHTVMKIKTLRDELEKQDAARWQKDAADAAASTTTAEQAFYSNTSGAPRTVAKVGFLPSAALTANDTTNATITVRRRASGGGSAVTVAALTTNLASGNWTAFAKKDFGSVANATIADGESLTVEITKGSTGVVVPAGRLLVEFA